MASPFCPSAAHVHNLQNPKEIHCCCLNYWVHGTQADTQTKDLAFPLFIQSLYFETEVFLHMLPD